MNGALAWLCRASMRNARRLTTDGSTLMAWRLASQPTPA
jgi:hypothetical protein